MQEKSLCLLKLFNIMLNKKVFFILIQTSLICSSLLFLACERNVLTQNFSAELFEPCMILNLEQNNTIEGNYITVIEANYNKKYIEISIPKNFYINSRNFKYWVVGWGDNKPLYDAGVENICEIKKIDLRKCRIFLGDLKRGKGFPTKNQRIVFWNTQPTGYVHVRNKPIIETSLWPEFHGNSISFGSIEFDEKLKKWVMLVNECDTDSIQIYAAVSQNLINWSAAEKGKPILTVSAFKNCQWAGWDQTGKIRQTPMVTDILRHKNKWYIFLNGYDKDGLRHIGLAISTGSLLGPFQIQKKPILSPGNPGLWDDSAVFYAKVKRYKNKFILFYDGKNTDNYERIGMAISKDLVSWKKSSKPVLDEHTGWRSAKFCTEPNYIEIRNDTIFLMVAGVKEFKMGFWHHYITKRMYMDKSGNVNDAQLGVFRSVDGGKTFVAHKNNPVFVNDYTNKHENEHMGGNFKFIELDTVKYFFYQAKSSFEGSKYNIMLRKKSLSNKRY